MVRQKKHEQISGDTFFSKKNLFPQFLKKYPSSNDVKKITVEVGSYALSITGFHQPQPFLMEQSDLKLRRDGMLEGFLFCCPLLNR